MVGEATGAGRGTLLPQSFLKLSRVGWKVAGQEWELDDVCFSGVL